MATRSKQSFAKRQKEMARKEKQERKAQRRRDRKLNRVGGDEIGAPVDPEQPLEPEPAEP